MQQVVTPINLEKLHAILAPLVGQPIWRVNRGYKSILYLDIGKRLPSEIFSDDTGEWLLETCGTDYTLKRLSQTLVSSEDDLTIIMNVMQQEITDKRIVAVKFESKTMGITLLIEGDLELSICPVDEDDEYEVPYWTLSTPNNMILEVGPNQTWSYTPM